MNLSPGVSKERVETFKRKTVVAEPPLVLHNIVNIAFWISLAGIMALYALL